VIIEVNIHFSCLTLLYNNSMLDMLDWCNSMLADAGNDLVGVSNSSRARKLANVFFGG
jgi:hypothetical protein